MPPDVCVCCMCMCIYFNMELFLMPRWTHCWRYHASRSTVVRNVHMLVANEHILPDIWSCMAVVSATHVNIVIILFRLAIC